MPNVIGILAQIAITVLGAGAVFLAACKIKWTFVLGLAAQPAWFYIAVTSRQWGILAVSVVYTANWTLGIYNWFVRTSRMAAA